jgi:hypothetical protein
MLVVPAQGRDDNLLLSFAAQPVKERGLTLAASALFYFSLLASSIYFVTTGAVYFVTWPRISPPGLAAV